MTDLSFFEQFDVKKVEIFLESRGVSAPRGYLDMSEIGDECERKLWFSVHQPIPKKITAKNLRLLKTCHNVEREIINDYRFAGYKITTQLLFSDFDNKFRGYCDGIIEGLNMSSLQHILDVKLCNEKNFNIFQEYGVAYHPIYGNKYYGMVQCFMGYSGLKRAYSVFENKNTAVRWTCRFRFNQNDFDKYRFKAEKILTAKTPLQEISSKQNYFKCLFCDYNNDKFCRGGLEK